MMPSLPKLIALAAILWGVWTIFRMIERRKDVANHNSDNARNRRDGDANSGADTGNGSANSKSGSFDLEECNVCGAWVAGTACGKENCPYQG
ncbi:MAG: hypothetical protein VW934_04610 [Alphaproteobacteria bacterium]